jgi:hypothetical protein
MSFFRLREFLRWANLRSSRVRSLRQCIAKSIAVLLTSGTMYSRIKRAYGHSSCNEGGA